MKFRKGVVLLSNTAIGECPICKGDIIETQKGYSCSNWREKGCKFVIWKNFYGKQITKAMAKALIQKGRTHEIKGWVSKRTGNSFNAYLKLDMVDGEYRVVFGFLN